MEILVGVSILLIVVVIISGYYRYNLKATRKSEAFYVAARMASSHLERAKALLSHPDSLASLTASMGDTLLVRTGKDTVEGRIYGVSMRYRKIAPSSDLVKIHCVVSWDEGRSTTMGTVHPLVAGSG